MISPLCFNFVAPASRRRCVDLDSRIGISVGHPVPFRHDLRKIGDRRKLFQQSAEQRQAVRPYLLIVYHDHDFVEKSIDGFSRRREQHQRAAVLSFLSKRLDPRSIDTDISREIFFFRS